LCTSSNNKLIYYNQIDKINSRYFEKPIIQQKRSTDSLSKSANKGMMSRNRADRLSVMTKDI